MTQAVVGTLPYMSPEQLRGETVDARSDIWSAGVVLHEMAVGKLPFQEKVPTATADAILHKITPAARTQKKDLSARLEEIILKCLEKEPENRYQSAKELAVDLRRVAMSAGAVQAAPAKGTRKSWAWRTAAIVLGLGAFLVAGGLFFRSRRVQALTPSDTIVLADFINTTGDTVFDDALKQALTAQLEQSPFLNILPETRVRDTLRLMGRSADEHLTPALGRDLCQRAGGKALLTGSIATLGAQYVVGLTANVCSRGNHLASEQVQAARKEDVLKALGKAASSLRSKLGESLSSVEKFDVPIEQVTTPSLDALKAYSLGRKALKDRGNAAAIPFYEHAIELDSNFAMAYAALAGAQFNRGGFGLAKVAAGNAFALRARVSERERFRISSLYYQLATGELERAIQVYRQWGETYPTDAFPHAAMGDSLTALGRSKEAAAETRQGLNLDPNMAVAYANLALYALGLNEPDNAGATITAGQLRGVNAYWLRFPAYYLAFLRREPEKMEQLLQEFLGKDGEEWSLSTQSDTEAYYGRLRRARAFSRRAAEARLRAGQDAMAAEWAMQPCAMLSSAPQRRPARKWRLRWPLPLRVGV